MAQDKNEVLFDNIGQVAEFDKEYKGNIDLNARPFLRNEDGSISTESSFGFRDDRNEEVLIPTIIEGKRWSEDDAVGNYYKTGKHLGKWPAPKDDTKDNSEYYKDLDKYAQRLHLRQEYMYRGK